MAWAVGKRVSRCSGVGRVVLFRNARRTSEQHVKDLHELVGGAPAGSHLFPAQLYQKAQVPVGKSTAIGHLEGVPAAQRPPSVCGTAHAPRGQVSYRPVVAPRSSVSSTRS